MASEATEQRLRELISSAHDDALKDAVEHYFTIWLTDSTGQPQRAVTGTRRAIASYQAARKQTSGELANTTYVKELLFAALDTALHDFLVKIEREFVRSGSTQPDRGVVERRSQALYAYRAARTAIENM